MINTLFGIKKEMTSTYDTRGRRVGATVLKISPNFITQIKSEENKDGYNAIQLGVSEKKNVKKPQIGHLKKTSIEQKVRFFREVRSKKSDTENLKPGEQIQVSQVFSKGDAVKVSAISKGKGFQGGVRRHGFKGGMRTHGQSDRLRAPGSISSGTTPGRVRKGKRMAGHMGMDQVSVKNLEVIKVDKKENLLIIKGAVPGPVGGLIKIIKLGRIKGYTPPPEEKEEEEVIESAEQNASEPEKTEEQPQAASVEAPKNEEVKENAS